jgi:hypothetical protein
VNTKAQRRLRKMPYHSEHLYALIRETDGKTEMCYRFAPSTKELWDAIVSEQILGTMHTAESLRNQGWTARPVYVEERGK